MNSQTFIKKQFDNNNGKERVFASIYKDEVGTIYSYGKHYPLLFKVAGHYFVNTAGYSVSTSRHIQWAKSAVDYNFTAVELSREDAYVISSSYHSDADKLKVLARATAQMVADATEACDAKKRKDTQVYRWLADTLGRAQASNIAVNNLLAEVL